jgi:hypothetical protein
MISTPYAEHIKCHCRAQPENTENLNSDTYRRKAFSRLAPKSPLAYASDLTTSLCKCFAQNFDTTFPARNELILKDLKRQMEPSASSEHVEYLFSGINSLSEVLD